MSGALYESMFVVDTSSIGADILLRSTGLFMLVDLVGDSGETSRRFVRLDVKARASDILCSDAVIWMILAKRLLTTASSDSRRRCK